MYLWNAVLAKEVWYIAYAICHSLYTMLCIHYTNIIYVAISHVTNIGEITQLFKFVVYQKDIVVWLF